MESQACIECSDETPKGIQPCNMCTSHRGMIPIRPNNHEEALQLALKQKTESNLARCYIELYSQVFKVGPTFTVPEGMESVRVSCMFNQIK